MGERSPRGSGRAEEAVASPRRNAGAGALRPDLPECSSPHMTQAMENRTSSREWEPSAARATSASADGTRRFAERFADRFTEDFHRDALAGLSLSSIGLGTYLGDCTDADDARYIETARQAFDSGVNVVDT